MNKRKTLIKPTLALVCTAAILWLAVGCWEEIDPDYQCGTKSLERANKAVEVFNELKLDLIASLASGRQREIS